MEQVKQKLMEFYYSVAMTMFKVSDDEFKLFFEFLTKLFKKTPLELYHEQGRFIYLLFDDFEVEITYNYINVVRDDGVKIHIELDDKLSSAIELMISYTDKIFDTTNELVEPLMGGNNG